MEIKPSFFTQLPCIFPSLLRKRRKKRKKNWDYVQFARAISCVIGLPPPVFFSFVFLGKVVSSPYPFTVQPSGSFLITLASALCPLSGRAVMVGKLRTGDFWWRWVCGLEAVCQSACLSVSQQVFIYLSGCRAAYLMAGTRGLPPCSLSPSYHPTCDCHINSFPDRVLVLLNSCSSVLEAPIPSRKE